ncbi:MAG: hypothetical protein NC911_10185 [Candidatus Omnitrophica bacterium]|nr:hypothetical protein [Candidatus Omnitrophota bacterium]
MPDGSGYQGIIQTRFYDSSGILKFSFNGNLFYPEFSFDGIFPEVNLLKFFTAVNDQVIVSGIVKSQVEGKVSPGSFQLSLRIESVPARGVKQTLNFGAVKALTALGGGGTIRAITKSDFHYRKLAGRLTLADGYLTIEGLAGRHGHYQYFLQSSPWGQGINVFVDPEMNTIRLEYLLSRLQTAFSRSGKVDLR